MDAKKVFMILFSALLLGGCASVISRDVLKGVDRDITLPAVQADPERYRGSTVLWGGVIVSSENRKDTTVIEVMQSELTYSDRPTGKDSKGRFLIEAPGFLDTMVYKADKLVTVAGTVKGVETKKIGQMDYTYPVITPLELRLSEPYVEPDFRDYPPWYYQQPYGPFYPWPYSPWPYGPYGPYGPPYGPYGPHWPYWPPPP